MGCYPKPMAEIYHIAHEGLLLDHSLKQLLRGYEKTQHEGQTRVIAYFGLPTPHRMERNRQPEEIIAARLRDMLGTERDLFTEPAAWSSEYAQSILRVDLRAHTADLFLQWHARLFDEQSVAPPGR